MRDWEYDPFKNKEIEDVSETKDDDEETSSVVDWNKGFVMGPVEEDLAIEVEPLEKNSKEDVDMSDVVELE